MTRLDAVQYIISKANESLETEDILDNGINENGQSKNTKRALLINFV